MFKTTMGKGFQMTFKNGNTISVQFGFGNYCSGGNNKTEMENVNLWKHSASCENAEIAIWDKDGNWITESFIDCGGDQVKGYLSADEVANLIAEVSK